MPAAVDPAGLVRAARRLRYRVRPGRESALAGAYQSARPGMGLTFLELKPYEPGDDPRRIDWNATARRDRPFTRQFIDERALLVWIWLDVSPSMAFGPAGASKYERAVQAAALLAAAVIHQGDRAGLSAIGIQGTIPPQIRPMGGGRQLWRLLRALVATRPESPLTASLKSGAPSALAASSEFLARARTRARANRGWIVVLSDFLVEEPVGPWSRLCRNHEVLALRVVEPREVELPDVGWIDVVDTETGLVRPMDTGSRRVRAEYAEAANQRASRFQAWCKATGVHGADLPTEAEPLATLIKLLSSKRPHDRAGQPRR